MTSRRGFDPAEVKAFLAQVADELRARRHQEATLERALSEAEQRAAHPSFDQDTLMSAVGEETASILRSAHAAATDIRAKAEDNAARILKEAHDRSSAMLADAEGILGKHTAEAEAQAARITDAARAEMERAREGVRQEAEAVRSQIEAERKLTVEAAQGARERILGDLTRRRKVAMVQIEQLRAGRERLLEAYKVVRRTLDEVTGELQRADSAARAAAEAAGHRPLPPDSDDLDVAAAGAAFGVVGAASVPEPRGAEAATADAAEAEHAGNESAVGGAGDGVEAASPGPSGPGPGSGPAAAEPEPGRAVTPEMEPADSPEGPAGPAPEIHQAGGPNEPLGSVAGKVDVAGPARRSGGRAVEERRLSSLRVLRRQKDPKEAPERPSAPPRPTNGEVSGAIDRDRTPTISDVAGTASPDALVDADPAAIGEAEDKSGSVDGLFARIRAGREQAVADARHVLADGSSRNESGRPAESGSPLHAEAEGAETDADPQRVSAEDEAVLQRRDEAVGTIETTLSRRLKRALQDEQNDLLDRLRGLRSQPTAALVLPAADAHAKRFADAGRPSLDKAVKAGVAFAVASRHEVPASDAAATDMPDVDDLAAELAAAVVDPLRRRLEQAFTDGGDEDQSVLVEALGAAYREWKTQRIEDLASDHVAQAFVRGAFGATPEGTRLRWVVEDVNGPCPDCDDNALAGGLVKGEPFPTGQPFPPAHAGCRCILVPEPAQTAAPG